MGNTDKDVSIKTTTAAAAHHEKHGLRYPKHVWSPAGGWFSQPKNWKSNTAMMGVVIFGIAALTWSVSAEREERMSFPEPDRFYPSRYWSKQIIEHEKKLKEAGQQ